MTNYFELYNIPISFRPDPTVVKAKFYELERRYHPDRFVQCGNAEKTEALRMAALNNDAYKILSNGDATMAYILKLNNLLEDEEEYTLSPEFLLEMMELNEAISEYEMETGDNDTKQEALQELEAQFEYWETEMAELIKKFDTGDRSPELLLDLKDYYFRKKYLLHIQQRIDRFAAR